MFVRIKKGEPLSHFSDVIGHSFSRSKAFAQSHKGAMLVFWFTLIFADFLNYFLQSQVARGQAEESRLFEICFQLFILYFSVVFIHFVSNRYHARRISVLKLFGESLLLSPGYLLQAILLVILVLLSLCLLVIPGIFCGITFYIAPLLSVLYPGYEGKTFLLSHELSKGRLLEFGVVIILTAILPFIPDGVGLVLTGELNSIWSLWLAPFDGLLFLMSELLVVFFVLGLLEIHFPKDFQDPKISS